MADDTLPFDELDPCCQKEILEERNRAAVTQRLRKYDKLNSRHDTINAVFGGLKKHKACPCCISQAVDYPLLGRLRRDLTVDKELVSEGNEDHQHSDDTDDDDDELWAGLGLDALTPEEEERLLVMKERASMLEAASLMGFAMHNEDSITHINEMIAQGRCIVCHIVNVNMLSCAYVDHALEKLAIKYLGTVFRRVDITEESDEFKKKWNMSSDGGATACLSVFNGGSLTAYTYDLKQFGEGNDSDSAEYVFYLEELEKYLDNIGGLKMSCGDTMMQLTSGQYLDEENSDDEKLESYCDLIGCDRHFPHEHIGVNGGGSLSGAAAATEALPSNWNYKV